MQLGDDAQRAGGREPGAHAPTDAIAEVDARWRTADKKATKGGEFHAFLDILADDEVDHHIGRAAALAGVLVTGWDLDDAAKGHGGRCHPRFRHEVELRPNEHVSEVVVIPEVGCLRVIDEHPTIDGVGWVEQWSRRASDTGVCAHGPEEFGPLADAVAERADEVADVAEPLLAIDIGAIAAHRPLAAWQHFTGRHEPQSRVSQPRRIGRSAIGILC